MTRLVPPLDDEQRLALIASARTLRGVPFRHQGRTLRGIDCIGVLALSFASIGIELQDRTDYGKLPAQRKLAQSLRLHFGPPVKHGRVQMEDLQPGDIVSMTWGDEECHVGLVVDHPDGIGLLHAYLTSQRVIEHRLDELWLSRIFSAHRP